MRTARPLYKYLQASRLRSKRAFLDNLFAAKIEFYIKICKLKNKKKRTVNRQKQVYSP